MKRLIAALLLLLMLSAAHAEGTASIPVYVNGTATSGYIRETPIDMAGGDMYLPAGNAVSTWRGDAFRTNAAGALTEAPAGFNAVWTATFPGQGTSDEESALLSAHMQPTIVQWPKEVRQMLHMSDTHKAVTALKEALIPTQDGRILCLNLADGSLTRTLTTGYPIRGSVTVHPLSLPLLIAGQSSTRHAGGIGSVSGLRYLSAADGVTIRYVEDPAATLFTTSALIDRSTNTAVFLSAGGWLYTETLNTWLTQDARGELTSFLFYRPETVCARVSESTVITEPVMRGNLLWLANNAGQIICVDTTTMQPLWTASGLQWASALAMRETADGAQLIAVTGLGEAHLVCLDPDTGATLADIPLTLSAEGPSHASAPVIGQEGLDGLIFVNLTGTSDATAGLAELCAVDPQTQQIIWRVGYPDSVAPSAPVAVYDDAGNGYLVTAMEGEDSTTLLLLEGATGVIIDVLTLAGIEPCNPAVYQDMLIITTNTAEGGLVHGVQLTPAPAAAQPSSPEALTEAFMTAWQQNDQAAMLALCAPSWVSAQGNAAQTLFMYVANRTAVSWTLDATGDAPTLRVHLNLNNGRDPVWYTSPIAVTEEDGQWWIDPGFLTKLTRAGFIPSRHASRGRVPRRACRC